MWETVDIAGKPAQAMTPRSGARQAAVIFLHGHGEESLRTQPAFTDLFEQEQLSVICPSGGKSWWLDRIDERFDPLLTPLEYVSRSVSEWVRDNWGIAPPKQALLGISMGGQGALNLAYRRAMRFPVVAAISPALDFDRIHGKGFDVERLFPDAEAARQETAVLHLHPLNWPRYQFFCSDPEDKNWHEGAERLASKLSSSGVPYECDLTTSHGGHGWPYFNAMAPRVVRFLSESLKHL
jgi:S-formylglutathione hydrolase